MVQDVSYPYEEGKPILTLTQVVIEVFLLPVEPHTGANVWDNGQCYKIHPRVKIISKDSQPIVQEDLYCD